jgi:diguanylate cyclase (GGDEF)-like protein
VVPAKTGDKEQRNTTVPAVRRSSRAGAVALLVVVALAGLGTATVAGRQWGSVVNQRDRQSFDRRAQTVAARVASVLQRDADVTTTAASIEAQDPQLSNAGLSEWFTTLTTGHVPNALGATFIQPVLDYQLALYRVLVDSDPTSALRSGGSFSILPSTATSPYCLTRLLALDPAVRSAGDAALPPGLDWCATPAGSALSAARDTGTPAVAKVVAPDEGTLTGLEPAGKTPDAAQIQTLKSIEGALGQAVVFFAPVYSQTAPATEAARLASFEGWVGGIFDTGTVLAGAGVGHNALNVTLAARNPGAALTTVASEDAVTTATTLVDSVHTQAGGRWVITVARPPVTGWASGTRQGLVVGGVIVLATLAVLGVMGVLLRRRRAVVAPPAAVVAERAGDVDHMALHDLLTGLPTRPLIVDRTEQMLARSRRSKLPMAVLVMDLDGMDAFNERHGRARGDELLTAVAERLVAVLREADTVGRQDGDEFVVLTDGASLTAGPELVAERLIGVLREPFHLGEGDDEPVSISASVGIALGPRIDAASLLEDAHTALTEAKAAGGARYSLFGQDMPMALEGRKAFETELRIAVASDQFFLRYQPIFDIDTRTTTGVEALLRWQHPTRRVIPPDHFLPVLEETGLILPLGRWVLLEACRQGALLHAKGYRIAMSVNVSARQLESETIVDDVRDALDETSFAAHALVIEVTETTLMRDTALMVERLIALKSLGVRIAIDDFGTGYSTPAYLRQFPIDILKIDRSFISSMITTRDSSMLIHTLVQFGKTLGLETIAEGIEEEGQLDPLLAEQCDTGQGFLYGRPLSPTQLDIFLRTHLTQEPPLWVVPPMQGTR